MWEAEIPIIFMKNLVGLQFTSYLSPEHLSTLDLEITNS